MRVDKKKMKMTKLDDTTQKKKTFYFIITKNENVVIFSVSKNI